MIHKTMGFIPLELQAILNRSQKDAHPYDEQVVVNLMEYKFLLNPIRLSIIGYLIDLDVYPAFRLREILQISWGQFTAQIARLIEKGYISSTLDFYEGSPTKFLSIESIGIQEFNQLRTLLKGILYLT